jgi:chromosome partitioning protein
VPPDELHAFQRESFATEAKFWETLAELNDDLKRGLRGAVKGAVNGPHTCRWRPSNARSVPDPGFPTLSGCRGCDFSDDLWPLHALLHARSREGMSTRRYMVSWACGHAGVSELGRTMKIVAIISQKGGAGKTTLAVHLGTAAAEAGHVSAIIDLDPQATAAGWGDRRQAAEPEVISGQAVRLPALMKAAQDNGADFLVLDTAPNADLTASLAARSADLVLIPCRASTFNLEAIETTLLLAKAASKPAYVVLNAVPPRSGIGKEAAEGLTSRGARVAPRQITQRAAFTHSVIDGRTAQEFEPQGKAAEEIRQLYEWICSVVDMPARGHDRKVA